jgi:hypothetical protein
MKVNLMLADSAQAVQGKLYVLGAGWTITGPDPTPSAIAMVVEVPWNDANRLFRFQLSLLTGDGQPVIVPTPAGDRPLTLEGTFEAARPLGLRPGSSLTVPLAINMGPLPLEPDSMYVWSLAIDGETKEEWQLPFTTRPATPPRPDPAAPPRR